MPIHLAYRNTTHDFSKTGLSIAGIAAAIVLIFMQLGFRGAVEKTALGVYRQFDFDVILRSADYQQLVDAGTIDKNILIDVASRPEVESVNHVNVAVAEWQSRVDGRRRGIMILGVNPSRCPFRQTSLAKQLKQISKPFDLLIDQASHPAFGPANGEAFSPLDVGRKAEIGGKEITIAGTYPMGTGLAVNGSAILSDAGFSRLSPTSSPQRVTLGLVKLKKGSTANRFIDDLLIDYRGADGAVAIEGVTRENALRGESDRWLTKTPIGLIFTLGVAIATVIGGVIVYMVLVSDVNRRIHEYATLKAVGYSNAFLAMVVLFQAVFLAVFSFLPAVLLSASLYAMTQSMANVPLEMNRYRIAFVLLLTLLMCGLSGLLAVTKLWKAEPADLF